MGGKRHSGAASGGAGGKAVEVLNRGFQDSAERGEIPGAGKPRPNAVKLFSSVEMITLLADRDWLDEATKTIIQHWRRKHSRRTGWTAEKPTDTSLVARQN